MGLIPVVSTAATIATTHQFCQLVLRSLGVAGDTDPSAGVVRFAPNLKSNREAVEVVLEAIGKVGLKAGQDVFIALDVASSELWAGGAGCSHWSACCSGDCRCRGTGETRSGRTTERHHIEIPMAALLEAKGASDLLLAKQGEGRLYYRMGLRYAPQSLALAPLDRGFTVQRPSFAENGFGDARRREPTEDFRRRAEPSLRGEERPDVLRGETQFFLTFRPNVEMEAPKELRR